MIAKYFFSIKSFPPSHSIANEEFWYSATTSALNAGARAHFTVAVAAVLVLPQANPSATLLSARKHFLAQFSEMISSKKW